MIDEKRQGLVYEPMAGESIDRACDCAIAMAREFNATVAFKFNDIQLAARPEDNAVCLQGLFWSQSEQRQKKYSESPEGITAELELEQRKQSAERTIAELVDSKLNPAIDAGLGATVEWLSIYAPLADWIGINRRSDDVLRALLKAGYVNN